MNKRELITLGAAVSVCTAWVFIGVPVVGFLFGLVIIVLGNAR